MEILGIILILLGLLLLGVLYFAWVFFQHRKHWPLWMWRSLEELPSVAVPDGYRLRFYQPGDEDAWVRIVNAAFAAEKCVSVRVRRRDLDRYFPAGPVERATILFAEQAADGELVGTTAASVLRWKAPTPGLVAWMAVDPAHRRRGLGEALLTAALHALRERGHTDVLLCTNPALVSAVRLYERLGFVAAKRGDAVSEALVRRYWTNRARDQHRRPV